MKPRIPAENADIRERVRRAIVKDIALILIFRLVVFLPAFLYGYYTPPVRVGAVIAVEIVCLFPIVKTRIWKWFIGAGAFEGEITEIKHRRALLDRAAKRPAPIGGRQTPTAPMKRTPVGALYTNRPMEKTFVTRVTVREDGGRVRRVKYVVNDGDRLPDYKVGDRVRRFYGTEYMQILSRDGVPGDTVCVVCGAENGADAEECAVCASSLIK